MKQIKNLIKISCLTLVLIGFSIIIISFYISNPETQIVEKSVQESLQHLSLREPSSDKENPKINARKNAKPLNEEQLVKLKSLMKKQGELYLASTLQYINPKNGESPDREEILKHAVKNPLLFNLIQQKILQETPHDFVELRSNILSLVTDVTHRYEGSQKQELIALNYKIAQDELNSDLFIQSGSFNEISEYQKEGLIHDGILEEHNGQLVRSTFTNKVLALKLISLDKNKEMRSQFINQIQDLKFAQYNDDDRLLINTVIEHIQEN